MASVPYYADGTQWPLKLSRIRDSACYGRLYFLNVKVEEEYVSLRVPIVRVSLAHCMVLNVK